MNVTGSYQDLFNTDTSYDLFAGLVPNSVVVTDRDTLLQSEPLPDGSLLVGTASGVRGKALLGTARQVTVTNNADEITLELPQDIDEEATPRFAGINIDDFEIKTEPVFGLSIFDWSTGAGAVPLSVLPASGPLGSAVAVGTKLILNNDIDFLFGGTKQVIHAAMPAADSKWTLPDLGLTDVTFAALEASQRFTDETDSSSTVTGSVTFAGGVGIAKSLHAANIATGALTVGGTAVTPGSYVTTNTTQSVTATKTFAADVTFGTLDFGQIRFSTYDSGRNRIASGWTHDSDYFMEFYIHGVKTMELRNGYPGSGRDREVTMPGLVRTGRIVPTSGKTHDIGSSTQPYRSLYLGNDTGIISLGHNIRGSGRAELHLHSIGDDFSWIFFGKDARTDANAKWVLGSSPSTQDDTFRLSRATGLSGGAFSEVIDVIGSGANAGQTRFRTATDSASTTTGSAVFAGGVGVAKNITAGSVTVPNGTGSISIAHASTTAEARLHTNGDGIAQVQFGRDALGSANVKWSLSSRASGETDDLRVYRGPKLAGSWETIARVVGSGTDAGRTIFERTDDATSTTSGAVQIRGGLGVAKTLHAQDIKSDTVTANNLTLTNNLTVNNLTATYNVTANGIIFGAPGQSLLNHYEELWVNDIVFYPTVAGTTSPATLPADLRVVRIGLNVTITVRFKALYTPGIFTATSNTKMRCDIGLPEKFIGSLTPPPAMISVVNNGNAYIVGIVELGGGDMVVWAGPMGDFNGVCRIPSFSVSYNLFIEES